MKCTECGKEISPDGIACPNCGAPLPIKPPPKRTFTIRIIISLLFTVVGIAVFAFYILPAIYPPIIETTENTTSGDKVEEEYSVTPSEEYVDDLELFQRIADECINKEGCTESECKKVFTKESKIETCITEVKKVQQGNPLYNE